MLIPPCNISIIQIINNNIGNFQLLLLLNKLFCLALYPQKRNIGTNNAISRLQGKKKIFAPINAPT